MKIEKNYKQNESGARLINVTEVNFSRVVNKNQAVLIDFFADWCGPCRAIAPKVAELSQKYTGKVTIGKIDIDKNPKIADRFNIRSIPTLLLLKNGKEINRIVGSVPKATIEKTIEKVFNLKPEGEKKIAKPEI